MDAAEILSISEGEALSLFPGSKSSIKKRFRELAQAWHPDVNRHPKALQVFAHISRLHDVATGRSAPAKTTARRSPAKSWKLAAGGEIAVRPKAIHRGPLGDVIVTSGTVAYETVTGFEDVAEAEARAVQSFKFGSDAMKKANENFLPRLKRRLDAVGLTVNVYHRPADTVLLTDLARHLGGRIPPTHVAWIVSSLENMACYLNWLGVTHGAIAPENVLVSPAMHSIVLVGGWGYSTPFGQRPKALPERTLSLVPRLAVRGKAADPKVDLTLIRATAQELLGTSGGGGLALMKDVPDALRMWLSLPPRENAIEDYQSWEKCLVESFGPRKFVKLEVNPADVYAAA
ncbi:hypothetical protein GOB57_08205 [Sinorhizobium meliloti]|nr:hypothetical protein [Sinorhizobium meliloti]